MAKHTINAIYINVKIIYNNLVQVKMYKLKCTNVLHHNQPTSTKKSLYLRGIKNQRSILMNHPIK